MNAGRKVHYIYTDRFFKYATGFFYLGAACEGEIPKMAHITAAAVSLRHRFPLLRKVMNAHYTHCCSKIKSFSTLLAIFIPPYPHSYDVMTGINHAAYSCDAMIGINHAARVMSGAGVCRPGRPQQVPGTLMWQFNKKETREKKKMRNDCTVNRL